jgi:2,5-diamino-6-(ribosylamino)-4(3H)-pyrimidinone 5'-phosphate reductase
MRPYVLINVAMTADGKIDTFERRGAAISSPRDKERVDRLRAEADAVLVGGHTLHGEDPKLTVKSEALRLERLRRGLPANPMKVGIASIADLKPDSQFLTAGPARVVLFTTGQTSNDQLETLRACSADVFVHEGPAVDLESALETLNGLGVKRLMVEGGGTINFEFLHRGLVDEITAYVAPLVFGGAQAPTLADGLGVPCQAAIHLNLIEVEKWDDGGVILRYHIQ